MMFFRDKELIHQEWTTSTVRDLVSVPAEADEMIDFLFFRNGFALNGGAWLEHPPEVSLGAPTGVCRRCYAPQGFKPQVALPGEVCPIPSEVIGQVRDVDLTLLDDDARLDEVRSRAYLRWPGGDDHCLRVALIGRSNAADTFEAWVSARSASVTRLHGLFPAQPPLTPEILGELDVIVLFAPDRGYSGEEISALRAWVESGGGLIVMARLPTGGNNTNFFLTTFGMEFFDSGHVDQVIDFADHPAVRGVTMIPYDDGALVRTTTTGTIAVGAVVIATIAAGTVGMAVEVGQGRVVAWGDDEIHRASSFDGAPDARILWANMMSWVAHKL